MDDRKRENIRIEGMDTRPLGRQRPDGLYNSIVNARPVGPKESHRWESIRPSKTLVSSETTGRASGAIHVDSASASVTGVPAVILFSILTNSPASFAKAEFTVLSPAFSSGNLILTFNFGGGDILATYNYAIGASPSSILTGVKNLILNTSSIISMIDVAEVKVTDNLNKLVFTAKTAGADANGYTLNVSHGEGGATVTTYFDDFGGGEPAGETFKVTIDGEDTADIVIDGTNNTIPQIADEIVDAINDVSTGIPGWTAEAQQLNPKFDTFIIRVTSDATEDEEDDNGKLLTWTAQKIGSSIFPGTAVIASGGVNSVANWVTRMRIPRKNVDVSINVPLGESRSVIRASIATALANDATFATFYEIDTTETGFVKIDALADGAEFNSEILIDVDSRAFQYTIDPITGGSSVLGSGVLNFHVQKRTVKGEYSIDLTGSLSRYVLLYNNKIAIADPGKDFAITVEHALTTSSATRMATFATQGDITVIGLSDGGTPEQTLLLRDDTFFELNLSSLPGFSVQSNLGNRSRPINSNPIERYYGLAVRCAYRFTDGSHSPLTAPQYTIVNTMHIDGEDFSNRYLARILPVKNNLDSSFDKLIDGISVFVSISKNPGVVNFAELNNQFSDSDFQQYIKANVDWQEIMEDTLNGVFYEFAFRGFDEDNVVELVSKDVERVFTLSPADDDNLAGLHTIGAAIAGSYNSKVLLGNVSVAFNNNFVSNSFAQNDTTVTGTGIAHKFLVGFSSGGQQVITEQSMTLTSIRGRNFPGNVVAYPDRRAKWLEVWTNTGSNDVRLPIPRVKLGTGLEYSIEYDVYRLELKAADRGNFAYALWNIPRRTRRSVGGLRPEDMVMNGPIKTISGLDTKPGDPATDYSNPNAPLLLPGRFYATETDNPFVIPARQTYTVHTGLDEAITGFAVNSLPVSQGQFGQYPMFVFTRTSITAYEQVLDASIAFGRVSPFSNRVGATGPYGITNINQLIAFTSAEGVYLIGERMDRISDPVLGSLDFSQRCSVGFYEKEDTREVWVSDRTNVCVFNLTHGLWYKAGTEGSRGVKQYGDVDSALVGLAINGTLAEQEDLANNDDVTVSFDSGEMNLRAVDIRKRVWETVFRSRLSGQSQFTVQFIGYNTQGEAITILNAYATASRFRTRTGSFFAHKLVFSAPFKPGDWIESLYMEYEPRYGHRIR